MACIKLFIDSFFSLIFNCYNIRDCWYQNKLNSTMVEFIHTIFRSVSCRKPLASLISCNILTWMFFCCWCSAYRLFWWSLNTWGLGICCLGNFGHSISIHFLRLCLVSFTMSWTLRLFLIFALVLLSKSVNFIVCISF